MRVPRPGVPVPKPGKPKPGKPGRGKLKPMKPIEEKKVGRPVPPKKRG